MDQPPSDKASNSNQPNGKPGKRDPSLCPKDGSPKKRRWWFALLILVLIVPFAPILLDPDGKVLGHPLCDSPKAYYQFGYFLGQCWRDGILPLWNPHIMLGIPFLGEGQASVFHPVSFLFAFLKASLALNWLVGISFVLTGMFFYGYLRALGLSRPASWCGAATWSFSSAMVSRIYAGHLNILLTFISIPMILMFWERYRSGSGLRHLAGVALGYGLMIFAYYPQVLYIFSLFFLLYVLIQSSVAILERSSTLKHEAKNVLLFGLFVLLGIGLGAIQLLPSLDFVSRSFRQEGTLEFCGTLSFPPENLLTLIAPRFFGSTLMQAPGRYWGRNVFWEMWIYIGVLPLLLAVAGAWLAPRRRRVALLVCSVVFLVLGLGKNTSLFPIFFEYIPFFDVFRGSSKNTLVTLFCMVTLSAYGFEALFGETEKSQQQRYRRIAAIAGGFVFLVCIATAIFLVRNAETPGSNWERLLKWIMNSGEVFISPLTTDGKELVRITSTEAGEALARAILFLILSGAVIFFSLPGRWRKFTFLLPIALILADLLGIFLPLLKTFDRTTAQAPLVLEEPVQTPYPPRILVPFNPMPNIAMRSGYSEPFGYTGNTLKRYNDLINHLQQLNPKESRSESGFVQFTPQFSILGFDAVALEKVDVAPNARQLGQLGDRLLIPFDQSKTPRPRAFLAAAPKYFSRPDEALSYVLKHHADVWASPAIERKGAALPERPLENEESTRFISFDLNRIELEVTSKYPRELVLCSMFERNWKAQVNGLASPVEPANYVFRAVQVPAGTSRVVFEYKPTPFYIGATISGISLLIFLAFLGLTTMKFNRLRRTSQPEAKSNSVQEDLTEQWPQQSSGAC